MSDAYQDIFDRRKDSPLWWLNKSSDLHASAGALWVVMLEDKSQKFQNSLSLGKGFSMGAACWPVYQMLFGMSFELILKAIIVVSKKTLVHTHKLITLADNTDLHLTKPERDILILLTESIVWEGKYPVPKQKEHLDNHYKKANEVLFDSHKMGDFEVRRSNKTFDWENLNALWSKMSSHFFEIYE